MLIDRLWNCVNNLRQHLDQSILERETKAGLVSPLDSYRVDSSDIDNKCADQSKNDIRKREQLTDNRSGRELIPVGSIVPVRIFRRKESLAAIAYLNKCKSEISLIQIDITVRTLTEALEMGIIFDQAVVQSLQEILSRESKDTDVHVFGWEVKI